MLALDVFAYRKVSEIPLGHLILCGSYVSATPELGLRVEALGDHPVDRDGILLLRSDLSWNDVGPVVYGSSGELLGLDLGVPTFAVNDIPSAVAKRSYDPRLGMLALCGKGTSILAAIGGQPHHRAWWDVTSGQRNTGEERLLIERWCVGLSDVDGKFAPQLRFPEDFKRAVPA